MERREQLQISVTLEFSEKEPGAMNPTNIVGSTLDFRMSAGFNNESFFNESGGLTLLGATIVSKSLIHGLAGNMIGTTNVMDVEDHLKYAGEELAKIISLVSGNYERVPTEPQTK